MSEAGRGPASSAVAAAANLFAETLPAAWLSAATPEALGRQMLSRDSVAGLLPPKAIRLLVNSALNDGKRVGAELRWRYPGGGPQFIATALGVRVLEVDQQPWSGPWLRHADYCCRPPEIRLFGPALSPLDALLAQPGIGSRLGITRAAPVFVAHELYHHIESTRREPALARAHGVPRLRLGRWQFSAAVLSLSEIAAGACAQALLGLSYHAAILDIMALWHAAPHLALARCKALVETASDAPEPGEG